LAPGSTGLSDGSGGLMRQQTHKYSALFILIRSPRAAMAAKRFSSMADLAGQIERACQNKFGTPTVMLISAWDTFWDTATRRGVRFWRFWSYMLDARRPNK
jgi:predicted ATPase